MVDRTNWPCVSLTYDGASLGHLETVVPDLNSRGLSGTFFGTPTNLLDRVGAWRHALEAGHELGNGTLLEAGPLDEWSGDLIREQVNDAQHLLKDIFPSDRVPSVALPWDTGMIRDLVSDDAPVRAGITGMNRPGYTRLDAVRIIPATNATGLELVDYVTSAINECSWIVFAFADVGEGELAVDLASHRRLLDRLVEGKRGIPVRTFGEQGALLRNVATARNPRLV